MLTGLFVVPSSAGTEALLFAAAHRGDHLSDHGRDGSILRKRHSPARSRRRSTSYRAHHTPARPIATSYAIYPRRFQHRRVALQRHPANCGGTTATSASLVGSVQRRSARRPLADLGGAQHNSASPPRARAARGSRPDLNIKWVSCVLSPSRPPPSTPGTAAHQLHFVALGVPSSTLPRRSRRPAVDAGAVLGFALRLARTSPAAAARSSAAARLAFSRRWRPPNEPQPWRRQGAMGVWCCTSRHRLAGPHVAALQASNDAESPRMHRPARLCACLLAGWQCLTCRYRRCPLLGARRQSGCTACKSSHPPLVSCRQRPALQLGEPQGDRYSNRTAAHK